MRRAIGAMILATAFGLVGCEEEEAAPEEEVAAPEPEPEAGDEEVVVEPTADSVPVPQDFEAEAEAEITEDNYEERLDEIETEIEADLKAVAEKGG